MSDWLENFEMFGIQANEGEKSLMRFAMRKERERITGRIRAQICFDALADQDGRCSNHSGKCFELGLLVKELEEAK